MIKEEVSIGNDEIESGDPQSIIDPVWYSVSIYDDEKRYNSDLKAFSIPQKYIFAIQWYIAEVNNGGHDQFYYKSAGIVWKDALNGLQEINHIQAYEILKESANRLGGSPSMNRNERQEQLETCNADFEDLDDKFYEISDLEEFIMKYIQDNKTDFFFNGEIDKPDY